MTITAYQKSDIFAYKVICADPYRQGKWPDTPPGINDKTFHDKIRIWVRQEDAYGTESLQQGLSILITVTLAISL